ncbi:NACHT domain-containing protein [Streptomyces triculaminicus]|uniref:NACHT domain-containing protein n=1 Tax=Streptomyces triculaminicus TaxID=2816232 RepID=UPI0037BABD66
MSVRRLLSFSDALVLLGGDPPAVAVLDRALGGALNVATGGVGDGLLRMVDARGRVVGLGRDAVRGLGRRLGRAEGRAERMELLHAAHTVIVVVAWFEALGVIELPFGINELELTRSEQIALVGAPEPGGHGAAFARSLAAVEAPRPAPHRPFEDVTAELTCWYRQLSSRFYRFVEGLRFWGDLTETDRDAARRALWDGMLDEAVRQYESLYAQLAQQAPEFGFWVAQVEHQATRDRVRIALAGVEELLSEVARSLRPPTDVAAALAHSHEAALTRPVLDTSTTPDGILVPALREMYLDPDFRVRAVTGTGQGPASESWWEEVPVRNDLTSYLAGVLTSPGAADSPLLVLGQPGAGKSVLTRVLAARLPSVGFLPIRVPLRDVRAEDDLQEQLEQAVRTATGERVSWPELIRSAGGAVPVLLLDGFDELLQTTGVHHSDFLIRVTRFQEREAEQGRPVRAVVTSRTAVADRTRYPEGLVALRLEPFRPAQIRHWLGLWNEANASCLATRGLQPLTWDAVARHEPLAAQPLLLTMLALYDATDNGLRRDGDAPLDEAELYEELLTSFARREVDKTAPDALPEDGLEERAEQDLQRLSLVAFALLNRRRQWVSAAELDEDLTALLGRRSTGDASGFRTPLGAAEAALGRFFFVQRAQSVRDGRMLSTYEFLHATFGEYLVVRLALHVLGRLLTDRPSLALGARHVDDSLAYALLSYAPLSSRQILRFGKSLVRRLPDGERERLARLLVRVLDQHATRTDDPHPAYRPARIRTSSRHGIYGANLVLVVLLLGESVTADELFPGSSDAASAWHRHVLLWRSSFDEEQWTDFALSVSVRRGWTDTGRNLEIRLRSGELSSPEPLDMHWLYRDPHREYIGWSRTYWDEVWHKMDVSGGTNDSVVRHALDPVLEWLGPAVTTFTMYGHHEPAASLAHDLLRLLIGGSMGLAADEQATLYLRVHRALFLLPDDSQLQEPVARLLADMLDRDGSALSHDILRALAQRPRNLPGPLYERLLRAIRAHLPDLPPGTDV